MIQLYCYERQRRAVEVVLYPLLRNDIVRITSVEREGHTLRGREPGDTFVIVAGHRDPIPDEITTQLRIGGFQTITLDDSYLRALRYRAYRS